MLKKWPWDQIEKKWFRKRYKNQVDLFVDALSIVRSILYPRATLKLCIFYYFLLIKFIKFGGERGIRTLDSIATIHAFQACWLNRSHISPTNNVYDLS